MPAPRVHLIGAGGQLGRALSVRRFAGRTPIGYTSTQVDLTDGDSVRRALASLQPGDVVLNAAAYTDVDGAETDRAGAYAVNAEGPAYVAEATATAGARLIHVSTDYVFTGEHGRIAPFEPADLDARQSPATVYGASKLAGERAVQAADPAATIVRTSWLYTGAVDSPDFVGTMRRLEASRPQVSVVDDQHGSPTYVADLADGLVELVAQVWAAPAATAGAVLHAAGGGETTWYGLARAVFAGIGADPDRVRPCTTAEFPRPAPRPAFSVLGGRSWTDAGLTPLRPWPAALTAALTGEP